MRDKLIKLKRIRDLRVEQRQREYFQARAALEQAKEAVLRLQEEQRQVHVEIRQRLLSLVVPGETTNATTIEIRSMMIKNLEGYVLQLDRRIAEAQQLCEERRIVMEQRLQALKDAQKSADQIAALEERVGQEEERMFEIQEEMQQEPRSKPAL
jgi:flagellar biosynthesis chaperone FliJ